MEGLVSNVCSRAGVDEVAAKQSIGAILNYVKRRYSDSGRTNGSLDIGAILSNVQGAEELMKQEKAEEAALKASQDGAAGLFGLIWQILKVFGILLLLQRLLEPVFGDSAVKLIQAVEDGAEVKTILAQFGIEQQQALKVVKLIFDFLKDKLDKDTIWKITNNIPAIKALVGDEEEEIEDKKEL